MIAAAAIAFVASLCLTPLVIALLSRLRVVDHPNDRSSHEQPTLRGGGIAIAIAALGAVTLTGHLDLSSLRAVLVAACLLGVLGLIDDIRGIPALTRLALQLAISTIVFVGLVDTIAGPPLWVVALGAVSVLWLVAFVNAFNFMDGINGISAAQAIVAGVAYAALGQHQELTALVVGGVTIAAAAAGLLPFNFPRARIFIGDAGSYFVGAWLAVLVVLALRGGLTPEAAIAPLSLYLADTATTLIRRVRRGATWHEAHREHVYQQLVAGGWSHTVTTLVVAACIAACSLLGALTLDASIPARVAADLGVTAIVLTYLAFPKLLDWRARPPLPRPAVGKITGSHPR